MAGRSIFGQDGRENYMNAISQLDKNSLQLVDRFIVRLNRKGAGLSYVIVPGSSPDISILRFRLARNVHDCADATLKLGTIRYDGMTYIDFEDFQTLVSKVAVHLTTKSLYKEYKNSLSDPRTETGGLKM